MTAALQAARLELGLDVTVLDELELQYSDDMIVLALVQWVRERLGTEETAVEINSLQERLEDAEAETATTRMELEEALTKKDRELTALKASLAGASNHMKQALNELTRYQAKQG